MKYIIVTVMLLAAATVRADFSFEHGEHTYRVITQPATWGAARAAASAMTLGGEPGYLATIESAEENAAILAGIRAGLDELIPDETRAADGGDSGFLWIGGTDAQAEGVWIWDNSQSQFWAGDFNGAPVNGSYANWGVEPDNAGNQDAAAFGIEDWPVDFGDLGISGQWNDLQAANTLYYIVEFDTPKPKFALSLEEPAAGQTYSGIGNIRGWGFSLENIERVEVYVDDNYVFDAPYGAPRRDVAAAFPDIELARDSGFSLAFNYSSLGEGSHTIRIRAIDGFGSYLERSATFHVEAFHKVFIRRVDTVDFGQAALAAEGDEILIQGANIDGVIYDLRLKWRTSEQGLEIIGIDPLTTPESE